MTEFNNELRGALYVNDKQGVESRPDYSGNAQIGGKKYWIKGWKNFSKGDRMPYTGLIFEEQKPRPTPPPRPSDPDFDDKIPF